MLCPKCNRPVMDGARFCGSCGTAIESSGSGEQGTMIRPPSGSSGTATAAAGISGSAGAASAAASAAWANATHGFPGLIQRLKNIVLTPKTEWPVIELEPTSIGQLYAVYIMPLAAFAAVISFVHMSVIGTRVPFLGSYRVPLVSGLFYAIVSFCVGLLGVFLVGLIINGLAPTFSGQRNGRQAMKTAAYALTPAWLSSAFSLIPLGSLLQLIAGIYGIYVLSLGLPQLMRSPRDKAFGYTAAVVICTVILGIVLGAISAATGILGGYGGLRGGGMTGALTEKQAQQQAAATVGNVLGSMLGTDDKGKAGLSAAIDNMAQAGAKMEADQRAAGNSAAPVAMSQSAAQSPNSAADAPNAAAATAGLLTALGGALGGSHPVDPVDFHLLKAVLPDSLPDMQRVGAQGDSQQTLGVRQSSATANYQGSAGARVEIKIADISSVSGLLAVADAVNQNSNSESDTGFEKDTTMEGRRVHEKYDSSSKHSELNTIVAKRFSVDVTGDGIDMKTVEHYASNIDFGRLEALADQGARNH